jgi:hypothetical protein
VVCEKAQGQSGMYLATNANFEYHTFDVGWRLEEGIGIVKIYMYFIH